MPQRVKIKPRNPYFPPPGTSVAAPVASPIGGSYTSAVSVTLTAEAGNTIRYTLDGSVPTTTTGTVYSAAISISTTKTLRAIAVTSGGEISAVMSHTYTINTGSFDVTITINRGVVSGTSRLKPGLHLINDTLDGNSVSRTRAIGVMGSCSATACQHIIAFGGNGRFWDCSAETRDQMEWARLDRVMNDMDAAGQEKFIIFALCPGWMKGGADCSPYQDPLDSKFDTRFPTDIINPYNNIHNYDNYAEMCRRVALRYSGRNMRYTFWNEMKGLFSPALGHWDYVRYTTVYNKIAVAVKGADPTCKIGGPYSPVRAVGSPTASENSGVTGAWGTIDKQDLDPITYLLANATHLDHVAIDGAMALRDDDYAALPSGQIAQVEFYRAVDQWIRDASVAAGRGDLPIHWAEHYYGGKRAEPAEIPQLRAKYSIGLMWHVRGGSNWVHLWNPEDCGGLIDWHGHWTCCAGNGDNGGQELPLATLTRTWRDAFTPGTNFHVGTSSRTNVYALSNATQTILVNGTANTYTVQLSAGSADLGTTLLPFETKLLTI